MILNWINDYCDSGLNGGVSIISGLQDQTVLKCATRFIRSAASNHFTGTQLNATSNPSVRQEVVENPQVTDLAITKGKIDSFFQNATWII